MLKILEVIAVLGATLFWNIALAQPESPLPVVLQPFVKSGAKIAYIGSQDEIEGYIATVEQMDSTTGERKQLLQPIYVLNQGNYVIPGMLFDKDNVNITAIQFRKYFDVQKQNQISSEKNTMIEDAEQTLMIPVGNPKAPVIYMVANPSCGYCHATWRDLSPYVESGMIQLKVILTAFSADPTTTPAALWILSNKNPAELWLAGFGSSAKPIPLKEKQDFSEKVKKELQRNEAFSRKYKIAATPTLFYQKKDGSVEQHVGWPGDGLADFLDALVLVSDHTPKGEK